MVTKLGVSLLKKSVHNMLFLAHEFLSFFEAVRLAFDVNNGAVMQDTIQDGGWCHKGVECGEKKR